MDLIEFKQAKLVVKKLVLKKRFFNNEKTDKIFLHLMLIILFALNINKAQTIAYTKHVTTFIGTMPLADPEMLGSKLQKDWRPWARPNFPGSSLPKAVIHRHKTIQVKTDDKMTIKIARNGGWAAVFK